MRLLILALFLYLAYRLVRPFLGWRKGPSSPAKSIRGEQMVLDPQCGTYLPRSEALEKTLGGERRYFCSRACMDAFAGRDTK